MRIMSAAILLVLASVVPASAAKQFSYFRVGNPADVTTATTGGTVLMGGSTDVDAAFQWMCGRAGNGDFLVIRATGTDAYNPYIQQLCPAANSVATVALLRLSALTGERRYAEAADAVLRLLAPTMAEHPGAFPYLLAAVDLATSGVSEIAVVGNRPDLVGAVQERYLPSAVLAWGEPYDSPLWHDRRDGLAYVCRDFSCRQPVGDVDALVAQLADAAG